MSKIIYAVAAVLAMTSCANSFNIEGTSSLSNLDGQKLYLKVFADTAFRDVDSCDVIHGQFFETFVGQNVLLIHFLYPYLYFYILNYPLK